MFVSVGSSMHTAHIIINCFTLLVRPLRRDQLLALLTELSNFSLAFLNHWNFSEHHLNFVWLSLCIMYVCSLTHLRPRGSWRSGWSWGPLWAETSDQISLSIPASILSIRHFCHSSSLPSFILNSYATVWLPNLSSRLSTYSIFSLQCKGHHVL